MNFIQDESSTYILEALYARLQTYLAGSVELPDFSSWLFSQVDAADAAGDSIGERLTYDIWLRLSEYSAGQWTEPELKEQLLQLVVEPDPVVHLSVGDTSSTVAVASQSTTIWERLLNARSPIRVHKLSVTASG